MDWSTVDFAIVSTEFFKAVAVAIPVVMVFTAFRKAWGFIISQVRGA